MKAKRLICLATAAVFTASMAAVFAGCGGDDGDKVTVTWYDDGMKELRVDKVDVGSKIESWTPTKDEYIFTRWYVDSSKSLVFDFDTVIEEDTNLFAGWRSAVAAEDNRIWYAIGTGAETLKASNWAFATEPEYEQIPVIDDDGNETGEMKNGDPILDDDNYAKFSVKAGYEDLIFEAVEGEENTFTLTLTLRPGDTFRFLTGAFNSDWTGDNSLGQAGIGQVEGFEYAAGDAGGEAVEAADRKYGVVKDSEGEEVFFGYYENNHLDTTYWNLHVGDGMDGIYTFTMTTIPGEDAETVITWERTPLKAQAVTHMMYLTGTYNGNGKTNAFWNPTAEDVVTATPSEEDPEEMTYTKNEVEGLVWLEKQTDGETYIGYVTITEDDLLPEGTTWGAGNENKAFIKVKNAINGSDYGPNGGTGNVALDEGVGVYCIVYNSETNDVKAEKCSYYVVGTLVDSEGNNVNFTTGAEFKMTTADDGATYTYELEVADMTEVDGYTWLSKGICGLQVVYGTVLGGAKDWKSAYASGLNTNEEDHDNYYVAEPGTYTITYTVSTDKWTIVKA